MGVCSLGLPSRICHLAARSTIGGKPTVAELAGPALTFEPATLFQGQHPVNERAWWGLMTLPFLPRVELL